MHVFVSGTDDKPEDSSEGAASPGAGSPTTDDPQYEHPLCGHTPLLPRPQNPGWDVSFIIKHVVPTNQSDCLKHLSSHAYNDVICTLANTWGNGHAYHSVASLLQW